MLTLTEYLHRNNQSITIRNKWYATWPFDIMIMDKKFVLCDHCEIDIHCWPNYQILPRMTEFSLNHSINSIEPSTVIATVHWPWFTYWRVAIIFISHLFLIDVFKRLLSNMIIQIRFDIYPFWRNSLQKLTNPHGKNMTLKQKWKANQLLQFQFAKCFANEFNILVRIVRFYAWAQCTIHSLWTTCNHRLNTRELISDLFARRLVQL